MTATIWRLVAVFALLCVPSALSQDSSPSPNASPDSTGGSSLSAAQKACRLLRDAFPQLVAFPGSTQYAQDIDHWAESSEQNATCSIEPRTPQDVSSIVSLSTLDGLSFSIGDDPCLTCASVTDPFGQLRIVGRSDVRSPFAVKSGGHAYNIGFSSTTGVQISLVRFNSVTVNRAARTVTLGTGLTWDQVYQRLEPYGVMVAGARLPGIGVGGYSLGGGYSWKTNQVGLTIDTITSFDLVLPSGEITRVTDANNADLFFALRGGLNNFGIVTAITFRSHPQTLVYGGTVAYSADVFDQVNNATRDFDYTNTDPKAQIFLTYITVAGQLSASIVLFYDAPTIPRGIFNRFLNIPSVSQQLSTQTFTNFLATSFGGGDLGIGPFGMGQQVIPILKYTQPILQEMVNQVVATGAALSSRVNDSLVVVTVSPEPFLNPNAQSKGGAWPHLPSRQTTPAAAFIAYQASTSVPHSVFIDALKTMSRNIQRVAVQAGQSRWDDLLYPNYALPDTPLSLLYGSNLPRLNQIARRYDPRGVMKLAGGFKLG